MNTERYATRCKAWCKVNISLRVTGRLENGYHTLESFFLPLAVPFDVLHITPVHSGDIALTCSDKSLESPQNLVVRAYRAFAHATGYSPGLAVHLEKNIPYGAGLGGGSSDAAALLRYLNNTARSAGADHLQDTELMSLAATLGADVPFFCINRPAMVSGIGDVIVPTVSPFAGIHLVLVCPRIHVNTAWAFATWDEKNGKKLTDRSLTNTPGNDTSRFVRGIHVQNDLCPIIFEIYPELREIVVRLYDLKADAASMSGSGSSIFGLFLDGNAAQTALMAFENAGERVYHHVL